MKWRVERDEPVVTAEPSPRAEHRTSREPAVGQQAVGQQAVGDIHVDALMRIIHTLTGAGSNRPTNELDVRQRLVVQTLGLHGAQPIAAIGSLLGMSASTMTGIVDRLESLGLVERLPHPSDRRVTLVGLTSRGDATFAQERQFYASILQATVSGLDDTSFAAVLDALAALSVLDQENKQ